MARINHTNTRNYREPFLVIKWKRNNGDGLESVREFNSRWFFGSVMQDRSITTSINERNEAETLSIKVLNTSTYIENGDLIYRAKKVFQIISVDADQYNKQEQMLKATYLSDIEKQVDLYEYIKKLPFNESVKKGGFAYVDWVEKQIKVVDDKVGDVDQRFTLLIKENELDKDKINKHIKTHDDSLEALKTHLKASFERLSSVDDDITQQIETTKQVIEEKSSQLNSALQQQALDHNSQIATVDSKLDREIEKLNSEDIALHQEANEISERLSLLNESNTQLDLKVKELSADVKEANNNIQIIEQKQSQNNAQNLESFSSINLYIDQLKAKDVSIDSEINRHNLEIQELKTSDTLTREEIEKINVKATTNSSQLQELQSSLSGTSQQLSELQKTQSASANSLTEKMARVEAINHEQTQHIEQLKLSLQTNSQADAETLEKFNQLSQQNQQKHVELHTEVEVIKQQTQTLLSNSEKINSLEASLNVLQQKSSEWDSAKNNVQGLQEQGQSVNSQLENLRQEIQSNKNTLTQQSSNINKIPTIEQEVNLLKTKQVRSEQINNSNAQLGTKIGELESSISEIRRNADDPNIVKKNQRNEFSEKIVMSNGRSVDFYPGEFNSETGTYYGMWATNSNHFRLAGNKNGSWRDIIDIDYETLNSSVLKTYIDSKAQSSTNAVKSELNRKIEEVRSSVSSVPKLSTTNTFTGTNTFNLLNVKRSVDFKSGDTTLYSQYVSSSDSKIVLSAKSSGWSADTVLFAFDRNGYLTSSSLKSYIDEKSYGIVSRHEVKEDINSAKQELNRSISSKKQELDGNIRSLSSKISSLESSIESLKRQVTSSSTGKGTIKWVKVKENYERNPSIGATIASFSASESKTYLIQISVEGNGKNFRYQFIQSQVDDIDYKNVISFPVNWKRNWSDSDIAESLNLAIFSISDGSIRWLGVCQVWDAKSSWSSENMSEIRVKIYEMAIE